MHALLVFHSRFVSIGKKSGREWTVAAVAAASFFWACFLITSPNIIFYWPYLVYTISSGSSFSGRSMLNNVAQQREDRIPSRLVPIHAKRGKSVGFHQPQIVFGIWTRFTTGLSFSLWARQINVPRRFSLSLPGLIRDDPPKNFKGPTYLTREPKNNCDIIFATWTRWRNPLDLTPQRSYCMLSSVDNSEPHGCSEMMKSRPPLHATSRPQRLAVRLSKTYKGNHTLCLYLLFDQK